jgi:hypothetical protein
MESNAENSTMSSVQQRFCDRYPRNRKVSIMLDYQMVVLSREVSRERTQGLPMQTTADHAVSDFLRDSHRKVMAFLAKPVNMVNGQRYQNKHRSLEGTT